MESDASGDVSKFQDDVEKGSTVNNNLEDDIRALNDSLRWTEAELKSAQEHVLSLGDSVNSWSLMSEGALKRAAEQVILTSLKRGLLVTKLNMRGSIFGTRRFCHRILQLATSSNACDPKILWSAPQNELDEFDLARATDQTCTLSGQKRSMNARDVVEMQFGKSSGVYREVASRGDVDGAKTLANRCVSIVTSSRTLDLIFRDSSEAIGAFIVIQRLVIRSTVSSAGAGTVSRAKQRPSWYQTREQLQWQCGQLAIENLQKRRSSTASSASPDLSTSNPTMACASDEIDFSRLVPLFALVQRDIRSAATSRASFRATLRIHKDAVQTLPLPASNERIRRIVSEVQYRKDLIRESGLFVNSTYYPLASSGANYDICIRGVCDVLRGVELVANPVGASPAKRKMKRRRESKEVAHILPEVLRSASRTLTDGDAFSVLHRCFSVSQKVLITPSGPQTPISVFVSHDAIVTIQSKSSFNAVYLSRDPRRKPAVWATIHTTVVENISFDSKGTPSRVRHLTVQL
eukprot:g1162.t1